MKISLAHDTPNMPNPPTSQNSARFFGLALGPLWNELLTAWRGMLDWPVISWLWPASVICLWLPTGEKALSRDLNKPHSNPNPRARAARFNALVLPESLLLRSSLDLPKLQPPELAAALALEVQTLSPFESDDVVWAFESESKSTAALRVHISLTSRKLVAQHMAAAHPQLGMQNPEVWAPCVAGTGFMMLPGFGEARRLRESAAWRWASALLALFVMGLLVAIALTPSAQLYLRAAQASQAMQVLQAKAGPALAQRDSLLRATEQLAALAELTGTPISPLQILALITNALPDDTSLLNLSVQGLKVTIAGQTVNAAALMKQLGSTPGLRDVKAPTPAIKPLGAPKESFTIEFNIDPAQLKPST